MSAIDNVHPISVWEIIKKSTAYISKNMLWIIPTGVVISLLDYAVALWVLTGEPSSSIESLKLKLTSKLVEFCTTPLLAGTITVLLSKQILGDKTSWYQGLQKSAKKWVPLVLLQLMMGIAIGAASLAFVIPGIIVMCATSCALPAMMIEDLSPSNAFSRSWDLTKSNRFKIFIISCFSGLSIVLATICILAVTIKTPLTPFYQFSLFAILFAPFQALWPTITTLFFLELRSREQEIQLKEGSSELNNDTP